MPFHGFPMQPSAASAIVSLLVVLCLAPAGAAEQRPEVLGEFRISVHVEDELEFSNTPLDPRIDFHQALQEAGAVGVLDPNSVEVFDAAAQRVPSTLDDQFAYGDVGRVQWVVPDRRQRDFEIRFHTIAERSAPVPRRRVPLIGTGDLLRYNAGRPRPIVLHYGIELHDLDRDGQLDLVGAWDYAHQPGRPWGGLMVYPGVETTAGTPSSALEQSVPLFGEISRLRFVPSGAEKPDYFRQYPSYVSTAFADFNSDGRLDVVCTHRGEAAFFLHGDRREPSGMPIFEAAARFPLTGRAWKACRAVDLNQDGKLDLVVAGRLVVNRSKTGWPFEPGAETPLDIGDEPCFLDLDGDGAADAICASPERGPEVAFAERLTWRKNLGGEPPRFGEEQPLTGLDVDDISTISSFRHQGGQGVIVQHDAGQQITIFGCAHRVGETPRLRRVARAESMAAEMSLSDQAWPCVCDWDDDRDFDLLVGDGYGWPRIVLNEGSRAAPAFAEPKKIFAAGEPIRLLRNELLGPPDSWHNMGYPIPTLIDWDGDGLKDLVLANETNRIFWYKNVGATGRPEFGARLQVTCDNYPDSSQLRQQSATRAADPNSNNGVYPLENGRPFMWRTGPALADFNADGLVDLITLDGFRRRAVLYTQYRGRAGQLRLKREGELKLTDGRPIDDRIVQRAAHWTESFRAVDWDRDQRIDLIYSCAGSHNGILDNGSIYLLRNVGSKFEPVFEAPRTMRCFGEPIRITAHGPHPWAGDFDGDGWADLVAAVEWSVYPFYGHAALELPRRPRLVLGPAQELSGQ